MKKLTLEEVIEGIEEPRRERSILYPLKEVLMILLFAVLCGANSYAKVEMFGKTKEAWLKKYLPQLQYQPATFYKELTIHGIISACDQAVGSKSLE